MSEVLEDGSVIPSYLRGSDSSSQILGSQYSVSDWQLRVGEIIQAYDVDDPSNRNGKYIEYDVSVSHSNLGGGFTNITYPRCRVHSLFGGVADFLRWTPRIDNGGDGQSSLSSKVLLLCPNGNNRFALIIGGYPHPETTRQDTKFDDHDLFFEYNGLNVNINNDGDLTLTHKGATDNSGAIIDSSNGNSYISMTSDGKVKIGYLTSEGDKPLITLDKSDNTISLHTSQGVKINQATESMVFGTTYRNAETSMNNTLSEMMNSLFSLFTTASSLVATAAAQFTAASPFLLIPVAGPIMAAPLMATAGATLLSASLIMHTISSNFLQMFNAISIFEAQASLYLSQIHALSD